MGDVNHLEDVRRELGDCTRCPLHKGRTNIVFGAGNSGADLVFVGEAPGRAEDAQGLPFVGPAGRLLDDLLAGIDLARDDVYITNVVKCRPPGNRDPQPQEIEACGPFLADQLRLLEPRLVCALGRVAAGVLLQKNVQISKIHGQRLKGPGYFLIPVYHPAAALRTPSNRDLLKRDFELLRQYLDDSEPPPGPPAPEPEQMGLF